MKSRAVRARVFFHILMLILVFLMQSLPHFMPRIGGVYPLLLIPAVVCIGMFERELIGGFLGLFAGVLWDITSLRIAGFHAVLLLVIGCACGLMVIHLMRNSLLSAILLTFFSLLFYELCNWIFFYVLAGKEMLGYQLVHFALPRLAYSLVFTLPFYLLSRAAVKRMRREKA